jgi:hypothetical protein
MTDYMVQVLQVPQNKAFKIFAFVSLCGPISGVISGGRIFDKLGGYNSYRALHVIQAVGLCASVTGIIAACFNSVAVLAVF